MVAHRKRISKFKVDEAITFIGGLASKPWGISLPQIMEFCDCNETVAMNRIRAAREAMPELVEARHKLGFRKLDRRWFRNQDDADKFAASKVPIFDGAQPRTPERQPVSVIPLPTASPRPYADRHGALDHRQFPSRRGNTLVYQDGRRETFPGSEASVA